MKHFIKDFFNFKRQRTNKEALLFLAFHSGLIWGVLSLVQIAE